MKGYRFAAKQEIFPFSKMPRLVLGPPSLLCSEYLGHFPQYGKRPARESSAELKNDWRCAFTSPYAFVMCTGTNLLLPFGYRLGVPLKNVRVFLSVNI